MTMSELPSPPSSPGSAGQAPPGVIAGAARVFDLSLGRMLWSRRTVFMVLVVGLPVLIAIVVRLLATFEVSAVRTSAGGSTAFGLMMWGFFVRFAIPVLAVFYGTALIADEVEDRTITYLLIRPIPRASVLLGKFLAYLVCTAAAVLPAVVLIWLLIAPIQDGLAVSFPALVADLGILLAGLIAYGAIFALGGATLKRPILSGLIFIFGWENLALAMPGALKQFTVAHYLQGLVPHAAPADSSTAVLQAMFTHPSGLAESLIGLLVIAGLALWLAARAVGRREYVLDH